MKDSWEMRFEIAARELMQQMISVMHKFEGDDKWFGLNLGRSCPNGSEDTGEIKGHSPELVCK